MKKYKPFIAYSEITNEIYVIIGRDKYCVTDQVLKAVQQTGRAEPVKPIGYKDCSNAMLMLWMDKVVTDSEYSRIMDRLNKMYDRAKMDEVKE